MKIVHTVVDLHQHLVDIGNQRIALVPTMGNLHQGHLALADLARERAAVVVATVFVNPLQFGPNEDYDAYPRTLDADGAALAARGVDLLFAPSTTQMYPDGPRLATRVSVSGLSEELCGASRPGHFDGVTTVVSKLFHMVQPQLAVFGRKDLQQLTLIRTMIRDLSFPIEVIAAPTVRDEDGLALSSRNSLLDPEARRRAPGLYQTLRTLADALAAGERDHRALAGDALCTLSTLGFEPDYVEVRRADDLARPAPDDRDLVVLGAARLGRTRLIDNVSTTGAPELD